MENSGDKAQVPTVFPHVKIASTAPKRNEPFIYIGQLGADDLESSTRRKTKYSLIEVSKGRFRGMIPGVDPCNNSEIGSLKHDAWTYWGHSGAPLIKKKDGTLIALHSSWDEETLMGHGIPLQALRYFLKETVALTESISAYAKRALALM